MMTKSNVKNTLRQKVTKRLKISKDVKAIDQGLLNGGLKREMIMHYLKNYVWKVLKLVYHGGQS